GRSREAEEEFRTARQQIAELDTVPTDRLRESAQAPLPVSAPPPSGYGITIPPPAGRPCAPGTAYKVRFCRTSDDVRIAYACIGDGLPLVWAAHWLSHLSFGWESPVWRHWTEEFASDCSFIHYDERGNGLSDWDDLEFSTDAFVR